MSDEVQQQEELTDKNLPVTTLEEVRNRLLVSGDKFKSKKLGPYLGNQDRIEKLPKMAIIEAAMEANSRLGLAKTLYRRMMRIFGRMSDFDQGYYELEALLSHGIYGAYQVLDILVGGGSWEEYEDEDLKEAVDKTFQLLNMTGGR